MHRWASSCIPAERVERLILYGLDGDMVLGEMGPGMGMAVSKSLRSRGDGRLSADYMPIVIAAVKAAVQPEFDLGELRRRLIAPHL